MLSVQIHPVEGRCKPGKISMNTQGNRLDEGTNRFNGARYPYRSTGGKSISGAPS